MAASIEPGSILRSLRARPPGRAADDPARGAVFASALEQSEQFLKAASVVDYATKPVQLFYALSQAGRAIAAVRADEPWEIIGHGAGVMGGDPIGMTTVTLKAGAQGAVGVVARATGSELWVGDVALSALWASLPELPDGSQLIGDAVPVLPVEPDLGGMAILSSMEGYGVKVRPVEGGITARAAIRISRHIDLEKELATIAELLAPYPRAQGWSKTNLMTISTLDSGPPPVWLEWVREVDGKKVSTAVELLTEKWEAERYFRPGLGENAAVPSPLLAWWGILLALSSLARYSSVRGVKRSISTTRQ